MENYTSFYGKGPKSFYNKGNSYGGLIEITQDVTIGPLNIASFNTNIKKPLKKLLVNINPIQNLHGYNNPWSGGGGNNRLNPQTVPNVNSYVIANLGTITTPSGSSVWRHSDYIPVTPGEELYFGQITFKSSSSGTAFYDSNKTYISGVSGTNLSTANHVLTVPENAAFMRHSWVIQNGYNPDWENTVYIVPNSAPHEFTPYANICPITGWTGANIYVSPTDDPADGQTYSVTFPAETGTVYGGTLDVTTGVLTVDRVNIASYAGETLPGEWISDRDVYAAGTTPTTGAQVVYELATSATYQFTPQKITTLLGVNNVWADTGDIKKLTYLIKK